MLGLKLREEFQGKLLKGTAIELANDSKTGATQVGAQSFLGITGGGAQVFWLPTGRGCIKVNAATDAATWACPPPHQGQVLAFGRILWGEAGEYPQELVLQAGGRSAGLYHGRIT